MRYKRFLIASVVVVVVAVATYATLYLTRDKSQEERLAASWVTYVNAKGQEWSIPSGTYDFTVSSANGAYPKMTSGKIDPLDVKVGDIQKMQVTIVSPMPIASVYAEIETDAKQETVPLELAGQKPITASEVEKGPYAVDEQNRIVLNPVKTVSENNVAVKTVNAQALVEYTYLGQWTVRDTHTKTYHTKFTAVDTERKNDVLTLAWSDPVCSFVNGFLQSDCTPSSGVEGADATSTSIAAGQTLSLNGTSTLAFNPGKSIIIANTGHLSLGGGKIQQAYLCQTDADADGYPVNIARATSSLSDCGGGSIKRLSSVSNPDTADCYDSNANAKPGQTAFFSTDRGDGSFDYDCNGSVLKNHEFTIFDIAAPGGYQCQVGYTGNWHYYNTVVQYYKNGVATSSGPGLYANDGSRLEGCFRHNNVNPLNCGASEGFQCIAGGSWNPYYDGNACITPYGPTPPIAAIPATTTQTCR